MPLKEIDEVVDVDEVDISDMNNGKIVLHNDDYNSFEYVIECLRTILDYDTERAVAMTILIDKTGKQVVKEGPYSKMSRDCELLTAAGLSAEVV